MLALVSFTVSKQVEENMYFQAKMNSGNKARKLSGRAALTSSRSLQRCTKASTCAKMDALSSTQPNFENLWCVFADWSAVERQQVNILRDTRQFLVKSRHAIKSGSVIVQSLQYNTFKTPSHHKNVQVFCCRCIISAGSF